MTWDDPVLGTGLDDATCLQFERRVSYRELRRQVERWRDRLTARAIGAGSTVALQIPPSFTYIYALLALWRSGAQVLLFDHRVARPEVEEYLALCRPQFCVFADEGRRPLSLFREDVGVRLGERANGRPAESAHCLVQFTSGSMGKPTVVGRTGESLAAEIQRLRSIDGTTTAADRVLILSSLTHTWGLVAGVLHSLQAGAAIVFAPTSQARDWSSSRLSGDTSVRRPTPTGARATCGSRSGG